MEKYIDRRLEETRRHVRAVDLTVVSLRLSIGVLVYLLAAMVLDHWVLAEGLGKGSRLLLWAGLVLVGGWYCARFLFPLLIHRINPIFAAQTLERTRPTFKNGLINFLLLRRDQEAVQADELSKRVYQGLQVRTASELSRVTVGTTVDRLHVIRLGYLLATLVAICCLYFVVSPKNPLVSFGRVIFPWARIGAPTRVAIDAVVPGNTVAYQGDNLVVSAEVHGLRAGEPVSLYYSSVDGQSVDQSVPMSVPEGGFRYQGELPPGNLGFQQSLLYWIAAGDAASPTFRIDVQIPPAIVVERVEYEYPAYTGLPQRTAVREGDLRAVEGTRVTIHGSANYPIAQAFIELEGDSRPTVRMTAEGSTAVGRLTLAMSRTDPSQPEYSWYQLRFTDPERRENRRPIRHRVDVIADQKPEVRLVDPPPEELQLPVNGSVELKVHAEDPDFGLRRVELRAEREGRGLLIPPLLKKSRPDKPHLGPFEASYLFEPTRWSLKAGDKVTYWAEAADCKEKADDPSFVGNLAETERRTILIVAGDPQQKPSTKPQSKQGSQQKPKPGQQGDAGEQPSDRMQKPDGQDQQQPDGATDKQGDKDAPPKGRQPQEKPSPESDQTGKKQEQNDSSEDNNSGQGDQSGQQTGGNSGGKPDKGQGKAKSKSKPGESGEPSDTEEPSDSDSWQGDPSQAGKTGGKKDGSGGKAEQPSGPVDGDTNPAEAFERILDDQEKQQGKGQPGGQQKPSKSDSQPSGQEPQEGQAPSEKPDSGNQSSPDDMKAAGKPKKSDPGQSNAGQSAGEEKPGEKPDGNEQKGDNRKGAQRQKPSPGGKGTEGQDSEGQDADSNAEDTPGATSKAKSGEKGTSAKTKSSDSQDMGPEGTEGEKSDGPQEGAAGQNAKPSAPDKSSAGQSGDEEKTGAEKGKQERKPAPSKAAKPSDDAKAGNKPDRSEGDSGSEDSQADPSTKSGEKAPPGEKKGKQEKPDGAKRPGEPKTAERPEQKGASPDSMTGTDEEKTSKGGDPQKGPKGAEPQSRPESPGTGEPPNDKSSMPSPQEANQPGQKKQGETGMGKKDEQKGGGESSPSISPKTSKTKSDSEGDRSAEGKTGGGQEANQSGEGMPGSQTPSDQGNKGAPEKGEGDTSTKPGDKEMSDQPTGKPGEKGDGQGSGSQKLPGGEQPGKKMEKIDPSQKNTDAAKGAQPGTESSSGENSGQKGGSTAGNPTEGGGEPGKASQNAPPPAPPAPPPDDPNLEYARKQTTLALEHLADQLAKDKSELLERLGWDKAYAENFLRQWEQMRQAANQPGPQGDAAKRDLDKALKSLGLRPATSQIQKAKGPTDKIQQLQGTGRIPPPPEWTDLYKAYNEGVGGSKD